jgi:AcrR family transcriptional regulator
MNRKQRVTRRDAGRARGAPIVEAVLTRTLEELATAGIEGLSVERIARKAEVNKTSIYRRWPTREALVAAALEGISRQMAMQVPDTGSLRGDLLGVLGPIAQLLGSPVGRGLVRAALSESSESSVADLAGRLSQETTRPTHTLMERARARGEWRAGVSDEQLVFMLVGAMLHRVMLEHADLSPEWLESLVDLVLFGVLPREAGDRATAHRAE